MSDDPYTIRPNATLAAPTSLGGRLRNLGPGIVVSGSIVGSGEILLTAGLGAAVGFVLLWWVLFSCWVKSLIQAELARYIVTSGDTYLRALNRLPGKLRFFNKERVAWPVWLGLVGFIPATLMAGGIIGGAGQALGLLLEPLVPALNETAAALLATAMVMLILGTGAYVRLERAMVALVIAFTCATVISALLMQTTEWRATGADIASGLAFDFPLEHAVLALAMYGATGVASGEISAYTYWCVEKGYPSFIGRGDEPGWLERAKGWMRVVQTDVWVTLIILTCATLSFYFLGAGVLHRIGERPAGAQTIAVLSRMYTETLGPWSFWLFTFGAFCILFSTSLSGIGAGSRGFPDLLVTLGFIPRRNLTLRRKWIAGYVVLMPLASCGLYLGFPHPVALVTFGATYGAFMLPLQSFLTFYLQRRHMDPRIRPGPWIRWAMGAICAVQAFLSLFIVRNLLAG